MITTQNIYKAIKTRLSECIPDINCQIKDIKNVTPPCLYIEAGQGSLTEVAENTYQTNEIFNVVYFSENKTLLDLTNVEKRLLSALIKPLKVIDNNRRKFLKPEISKDINEDDYVFTVTLNFEFIQVADDVNPYEEYINELDMQVLQLEHKE